MATPMGLSCTLPPSCFTFFLPLLVSFVSRLGLVRLDSALLGPQPSLSLSLFLLLRYSPLLRPSSVLASRELRPSSSVPLPRVLPPLHPPAGPRGYQPLVFTSGQLGGDFDKTTSKLNPPARPLPPQIPLEPALTLATATSAPAPCVERGRSERSERRGVRRVEGSPLDLLSHTGKEEGRKEGPSTSRRTRTGGFVKTKARSFVESRSRGKEKERRGRGNVAGNVRGG